MTPRVRHVIDRALERYGVQITPDDVIEVERRLAAGDGIRLRSLADGSEYWAIQVKGVAMVAVWWPINSLIATFLQRTSAGKNRTTCGQTVWPRSIQLDDRFAKRRRAGTRRWRR